MSRASDGTYTAPTNSWNTAVEGTVIDESDWAETLSDVVDALTDSVSRTGKGSVSAHIDFDENGSPGTPASNVGRLYAADVGGATSLMFKDAAGNTYNLLLSSPGLAFSFDTSTDTASDPGNGDVRFNSSTYSSVTEIAIDDLDAIGNNVETFLQALAANTYIFFSKRSGAGIAVYQLVSASNESGFTKLTVTYVDHDGSFAATDPLSLSFGPAGSAGAPGATGLDWENAWQTSTAYAVNDGVSNDGSSYICTQAHTSGASTEPGTGASWASYWDLLAQKGADGAGVGDLVGPAASVDGELALYDGTTGKLLKRASTTGILKAASGVLSGASAGTDYQAPIGTISGIAKGNGANALTAATAGTDYVAPGGALGTPSSGTLTNCTGLPQAGVTGLTTSDTPTFAGVNINNADTTVSRHAAGVIAVEGVPLYAGIPITDKSADYTLVLADAQTCIRHPGSDSNNRTYTIPANASVAYPVGTVITFMNNHGTNTVTIAITSDTLTAASSGSTGSRTLGAHGVATAIKIASTSWFISGVALT